MNQSIAVHLCYQLCAYQVVSTTCVVHQAKRIQGPRDDACHTVSFSLTGQLLAVVIEVDEFWLPDY